MDIGRGRSTMNVALWIVQGLLAALFLFAGGAKLVLPLDQMAGPVALPGWFLRFLGVAEVLGALGLVLPGLLRIRSGLTSLAPATIDHEGLADASAANPFALPRLHPGIGSSNAPARSDRLGLRFL